MKLFSVLIANYNGEKFLRDCFSSLKKQSYLNIEIVIVDDCSNDNSVQIIKNFMNTSLMKITYEQNSKNMGCGYTKSRCVELANGEICGFLDSDDALEPNAIEKMVTYHEEYNECGLISSRYYICNSKLKIQYASPMLNKDNFKNYLLSPTLTHFNTFKRDVYLTTNGINKDITNGVDQDLCLKLEEVSDILFVSDILYKYRTYEKSISHGKGGQKTTFYNFAIRIEACQRRNLPLKTISSIYQFKVPGHNAFFSKLIRLAKKILYKLSRENSVNPYKLSLSKVGD